MTDAELIARLRLAKLERYGHGGARLAIINGNDRELIADFYGDGKWTEFFAALIHDAIADATPDETSAVCRRCARDGATVCSCNCECKRRAAQGETKS